MSKLKSFSRNVESCRLIDPWSVFQSHSRGSERYVKNRNGFPYLKLRSKCLWNTSSAVTVKVCLLCSLTRGTVLIRHLKDQLTLLRLSFLSELSALHLSLLSLGLRPQKTDQFKNNICWFSQNSILKGF